MENIIKKAIEGGYLYVKDKTPQQIDWLIRTFKNREKEVTLDPLFWQALGKACGWGEEWGGDDSITVHIEKDGQKNIHYAYCDFQWEYHALRFHEINLTEGWDKAVEYLTNLIK